MVVRWKSQRKNDRSKKEQNKNIQMAKSNAAGRYLKRQDLKQKEINHQCFRESEIQVEFRTFEKLEKNQRRSNFVLHRFYCKKGDNG